MSRQIRRQPANIRLVGRLTAAPRRNLRWPLTLAVYPGEGHRPLCESVFLAPAPLDIELLGVELAGRLSTCEVLRIELSDAQGASVAPTQWLGGAGELELQFEAGAEWPDVSPIAPVSPRLDGEGQAWLRVALEQGLGVGDALALLAKLEEAREPLDAVHRGLDPALASPGTSGASEGAPTSTWAAFSARFGEPRRNRAPLFTDAFVVEAVADAVPGDADGPLWSYPALTAWLAGIAAFECVADLAECASDGSRASARVLRGITSAVGSLAQAVGTVLNPHHPTPFGGAPEELERWVWDRYRPAHRALSRLAPWSRYALRDAQIASGAAYACAGGVVTIHGDGIDQRAQHFDVVSPGGEVLARVPARPVIGGAAITLPARAQLTSGAWPSSVRLRPWLGSSATVLGGRPHRVNLMKPEQGTPASIEVAVADLRGSLSAGPRRVIYARQRVSPSGHVCGGEVAIHVDVEDFVTAQISHKAPSGAAKRVARRRAAGDHDGWRTVVNLGGAHGLLTPGIHRVRLEARNAGCRLRRELEVRALHVQEAEITELLVDGEEGVVTADVGDSVTLSWRTEGACNLVLTAERLDTGALSEIELEPGASSAVASISGPTTFTLHAEGTILPQRWSGHATPVRTRRVATVSPRVALGPIEVSADPVRIGGELVVRWQAAGARTVAVAVEPQMRRFGVAAAGAGSTVLSEQACGQHTHRVVSRSATHLDVTVTAVGFDGRTSTRNVLVRLTPSIASAALEVVSESGPATDCVRSGGTLRLACGPVGEESGGVCAVPSVRLTLEVCNAAEPSVMLSLGGRRAPLAEGEAVDLQEGWPVERGGRGMVTVTVGGGEGEDVAARASFGIELT